MKIDRCRLPTSRFPTNKMVSGHSSGTAYCSVCLGLEAGYSRHPTDDMDDAPHAKADKTAQYDGQTKAPNSSDQPGDSSVEELVQTHLDTFLELAESDLPIAEDAEKAIALTDGGEEQ